MKICGAVRATAICLLAAVFPVRGATAPSQPVFDANRLMTHVRFLSQKVGARREGSAKERAAAAYVQRQLKSYGYRVSTESVSLPDGSRSQNVMTNKPKGKYFVIGAHYDSRDGTPGANDNASGVAVLLELAREFSKQKVVSARFIAFGAEERWEARYLVKAHRLNGSFQHVARLSVLEQRRISGMISLDMVGVGRVLQIGALARDKPSKRWAQAFLKSARGLKVPSEDFQTPPWSDHVAFAQAGVPAIWMWWYPDHLFHTPRDVVARVRPEKMQAAARVVWNALVK